MKEWEEVGRKTWNVYFPAGVQSAWMIIPTLKTVSVLTPNERQLVLSQGELTDPVTGIKLSLEDIFECLV